MPWILFIKAESLSGKRFYFYLVLLPTLPEGEVLGLAVAGGDGRVVTHLGDEIKRKAV